ncbi:MAG: sterol desaturase family protein [Comamonadaceae bacterium]|nr:MAG: sterol desaturase family protein [Comamonadaceae bacterium]
MRPILMRLLLPACVAGSLAAFFFARLTGASIELAILLASLATLAAAMALEPRMPLRADWNRPRGDRATDWTSFAVLAGAVQPLLNAASALAVVWLYGASGAAQGLFGAGWPFAAQLLVVTLLAEFGKYWAHRWHHSTPALWWLHALHHGSERLYAINNFRVHPLEYAIKHALSLLPLMLLGAPAEVLLGYIALTQPVQMLQHANLPLRHGWLNNVFSTNTLHRWHHSARRGEGDVNFGSALVLWDQVFGTFHHPGEARSPLRVGLYGNSVYPARQAFFSQVLSMLRPPCCRA